MDICGCYFIKNSFARIPIYVSTLSIVFMSDLSIHKMRLDLESVQGLIYT